MKKFIAGWLLACCSTLLWPTVPALWFIVCILLVAGGALAFKQFLIAGICMGISIFSFHAMFYRQAVRQINQVQAYHIIHGRIDELSNDPYRRKIILQIQTLNPLPYHLVHGKYLSLNQYFDVHHVSKSPLHIGDEVTLKAKLKAAHGSLDEGGFNYQRYLVSRSIIAQGTIKKLLHVTQHVSYRHQIRIQLEPYWRHLSENGLINALVFADKSKLNDRERQLWMHAGVGHLLAISGLHLGIIALWGGILGRLLMLLQPRWTLLPTISAMLAAWLYGEMALWPISTERAMVMLTLLLGARILKFPLQSAESWLLAAFILTVIWPFSILSEGFWLSFVAMAVVIFMLWLPAKTRWHYFPLTQVGLSVLMWPLQVLTFGYWSIWAIPLNWISIPLFSLLLIPLLFIGCCCALLHWSWGATKCLWLANLGLHYFQLGLLTLAHWAPLSIVIKPQMGGWFLVLLLLIGAAYLYRHWFWWCAVVVWIFGLLPRPISNRWRMDFLDVGQGLSVVLEKSGHAVIYDMGNRYPSGFSYAQSVIYPFLSERQLEPDKLVVSHADQDHYGGYTWLHQHYPRAESIFGDDPRFKIHNCHGKVLWHGLTLRFIQPKLITHSYNDLSCMLLITSPYHRVLLTGDIQRAGEQWWIEHYHFPIDVISVPHHGSKTSSSKMWLNQVHPKWAIVSNGFANYYHHPNKQVVARYRHLHVHLLTTAHWGQVSILFNKQAIKMITYRGNLYPFWYNRLLVNDSSG